MITKTYNRIKQGVVWVKNNPKKALLTLVGISFVSAAPLLFPGTTEENKNDILPITFNGKEIAFPYTDDNTGETLIIKTDSGDYSGWNDVYGYLAAKNISNDSQSFKFQCLHGGSSNCSAMEEFKPQVAYQVEVPDFSDVPYECKSGWEEYTDPDFPLRTDYVCKGDPKTLRHCDSVDKIVCTTNEQTGSHFETRYKDEWGTIGKDIVEDLKHKDIKPTDSKFVPKEQFTYWIDAGQTKYFRFKLTFTPGTKCEPDDRTACKFYVKAFGSLGAYGNLDPWFSSSWGYRRKITTNETKIGSSTPITGLPLMFSTSTITDLKDITNGGKVGKSDGTDILITASDGTTKIPHELEFYSSSTGETVLHFISSTSTPLSTTTPTDYYVYYGNSGASDQQDISNVWDSNYQMVYHLGNGDSTSAGFYQDSTVNNKDATMTDADGDTAQTAGKVGNGMDFNGDADWIGTSSGSETTRPTYSFWFKPTDISQEGIITTAETPGSSTHDRSFSMDLASKVAFRIFDGAGKFASSTTSVVAGTWYYVVGTADGTNMRLYLNGVNEGTTAAGNPYTGYATPEFVMAFLHTGLPLSDNYYDGSLDEVRVSSAVRSADWIKTEYNNQSSPNTFWSVGSEEQDTPATGDAPGTVYLKADYRTKGDIRIK